jgi:GT2 family glycosyltransferase
MARRATLSSHSGIGSKAVNVAAVVLNWNAWRDTIVCVESLLHSQRIPDRIVICANGSSDESAERLLEWTNASSSAVPIAFVPLPCNLGYAGGNNIGIEYAMRDGADFIWILNNDTVVDPLALGHMIDVAASNDTIGIVGSKLLRFDAPDTIQALGGGYILPVLCHDTQLGAGKHTAFAGSRPIKLDHVIGASLLVRAETIRDVGLIDESYFLYREETDWCIRMRRAGWHLYCCTQAVVWHKQSHSIGFKSPLHDYYAVRNMLRLVRKFYPASLPVAFGYFAARSILPKIARLEFARLRAVLNAFRDFAYGVSGRPSYHSEVILVNSFADGTCTPEVQRKQSFLPLPEPIAHRLTATESPLAG